jgi:hypothetical protein
MLVSCRYRKPHEMVMPFDLILQGDLEPATTEQEQFLTRLKALSSSGATRGRALQVLGTPFESGAREELPPTAKWLAQKATDDDLLYFLPQHPVGGGYCVAVLLEFREGSCICATAMADDAPRDLSGEHDADERGQPERCRAEINPK